MSVDPTKVPQFARVNLLSGVIFWMFGGVISFSCARASSTDVAPKSPGDQFGMTLLVTIAVLLPMIAIGVERRIDSRLRRQQKQGRPPVVTLRILQGVYSAAVFVLGVTFGVSSAPGSEYAEFCVLVFALVQWVGLLLLSSAIGVETRRRDAADARLEMVHLLDEHHDALRELTRASDGLNRQPSASVTLRLFGGKVQATWHGRNRKK